MSAVAMEYTGEMGTVVSHPRQAEGAQKFLSHKIVNQHETTIAALRMAVECLKRVAKEPAWGFAERYILECELMLIELEAMDPSMPMSIEDFDDLSEKLAKLRAEFDRRIRGGMRRPASTT